MRLPLPSVAAAPAGAACAWRLDAGSAPEAAPRFLPPPALTFARYLRTRRICARDVGRMQICARDVGRMQICARDVGRMQTHQATKASSVTGLAKAFQAARAAESSTPFDGASGCGAVLVTKLSMLRVRCDDELEALNEQREPGSIALPIEMLQSPKPQAPDS